MTNKRWLTFLVLFAIASSAFAQEKPQAPTTVVYKTVGKVEIKADIHRPQATGQVPVVVWIHGGALIMGHRASVSRRVKGELLRSGIAIFSIDYRLAPETKLPEIIKDLEDAFSWLHKNGGRYGLDAKRIAVMGGSAGGYLTLTAGYRVKPAPQALVAFWGYGDLIGKWYSTPSPHRRHQTQVGKQTAWSQVRGQPISDSRERKGNGGEFYRFCRKTGTWPQAVSGGWDPHKEPERFYPYMPVKNVTKAYPPTILIHGTKDTDVPYEQSTMMAAEFKDKGVEHRLITIEGGEHGLGGGNPKVISAAYRDALDFVKAKLK